MSPAQHRAGKAFIHRGYFGPGMDGLGDARPITSAIGSGLLSAGGVIAAIPGGQLPGAIVAAVGALTGLIGGLFAPNVNNIAATHIVDQIETQLNQLEAGWQALPPSQKTQTNQAAFLELIDAALNKVQQGCSNPALGTSGQRCISERLVQGGTAPWCPNPGHTGCDWVTAYRVPIANDPNVIPDPAATVGGSVGGTVGGSSSIDNTVATVSQALGGVSPLWLGVGLIAAALLLVGDSK
jgi:hypothetical protein